METISTALGVISSATAFIPVLAPISGIMGVTGCLIGLISTMMTSTGKRFFSLFVKGFRYENFKKKHIKNPYILVHYVPI